MAAPSCGAARPLRCLITGGNSGVGFEVAKQLLQKGHEVIIACRDAQRGEAAVAALQQHTPRPAGAATACDPAAAASAAAASAARPSPPNVSAVHCDLASFASVRSCAALVRQRWPRLDLLVCNAAVIPASRHVTQDGLDEQLQVNHLAHLLLVHLLLPCLAKGQAAAAGLRSGADADVSTTPADANTATTSTNTNSSSTDSSSSSRIVVVGSTQHFQAPLQFQDPASLAAAPSPHQPQPPLPPQSLQQLSPMQLYAVTKLCNLWFVRHLATQVLPEVAPGVVANVVSPGFIPATGLGRHLAGNVLARLAWRYLMPLAPFAVSVKEGGERVVAACVGVQEGAVSGGFFSKRALVQPSEAAQDAAKAELLWRLSCAAVGIPPGRFGWCEGGGRVVSA